MDGYSCVHSRCAGIDRAATDGEIINLENTIHGGVAAIDGTAANSDVCKGTIEGVCTGVVNVEGAGAESLAVDGQGAIDGINGAVITAVDGQGFTVGEDEAQVAIEKDSAVGGETAIDDIPCGLVFGADPILQEFAGEYGGGDVVLRTIGIDVVG